MEGVRSERTRSAIPTGDRRFMFITPRPQADDAPRPRRKQRPCGFGARPLRSGLSAVEVVVVVAILLIAALFLLMSLPRQREQARSASCRNNLRLIGVALLQYDQRVGCLPTIAGLGAESPIDGVRATKDRPPGPLAMLLQELGLPDLTGIDDPETPPKGKGEPGGMPAERVIAGFVCPSDSNATGGLFPAPVSYRATTGATPDGRGGAFEVGRRLSLKQVEAGDGQSYTVGFAERLVGDPKSVRLGVEGYIEVPGSVGEEGCAGADITSPRSDAGGSWLVADWRSTLYNHVLTPGSIPSCIARDGRSAAPAASSGHLVGTNALVLDGSVRTFTPSVDRRIWRAWSTVDEESARGPALVPDP